MAATKSRSGLLVSRAVAASDGERLVRASEEAGRPAELVMLDPDVPLSSETLDKVRCALLSVDVIGNSSKERVEPLLNAFGRATSQAPNLDWVQVCSSGMDRPLYGELQRRGVRLATGAGTNADAVIQTALTGMLALARGLPHWIDAQRRHRWEPLRGERTPVALEDQCALVVGMGAIGSGIARLLQALGLKVTGVRRSAAPAEHFDRVISFETIDVALPEADWVVLVCPLSNLTRGLLDARRLALLPRGARVLNLARGEVLVEAALVDALRRQALAGAYLDVFAPEPLHPDSPLWDLPQVLISPHSGGSSTGHQRNVIELFRRNVERAARGQSLENEWRPESGGA